MSSDGDKNQHGSATSAPDALLSTEYVPGRHASIRPVDETIGRICTDEMRDLLSKLDAASVDEEIDVCDAIVPVLGASDGHIVLSALTTGDYGWRDDNTFGGQERSLRGPDALRLRDELLRLLHQESSPQRSCAHADPHILSAVAALEQQRPATSQFDTSETKLTTDNSGNIKSLKIAGNSRPGAPPSNQFNTQESSLFVFSGNVETCTGAFRYRIFRIIDSTFFERAVLVVIMANSITLALDIPSTRNNPQIQNYLWGSEIVFQSLFTIECILKISALGFVLHKHSYLRSAWNKMDFIVVLTGFVSLAPGVDNYSVLRLLRVARPLRVVNRVPQMKSIMNALIQSLPGMRDVFLLLAFFLVIFAIVGVQLFAGKLHHRCYFPEDDLANYNSTQMLQLNATTLCTESQCLIMNDDQIPCGSDPSYGRQCAVAHPDVNNSTCTVRTDIYQDSVLNFDTFYSASLLVFKIISLDDWPADMYAVQNAMGWGVWLYFLLITLFGAFFCINLFLAVLSYEYYRAKVQAEIEEDGIQKKEDENAVWELVAEDPGENHLNSGIQSRASMVSRASQLLDACQTGSSCLTQSGRPDRLSCPRPSLKSLKSVRLVNPRKRRMSADQVSSLPSETDGRDSALSRARILVKSVVVHAYFSHYMLFVTCFNVVVMALDHHEAPRLLEDFINWANFTCSLIFIWEMLVKWFGLGLVDYFTELYRDTVPALVGEDNGRRMVVVTRRRLDGYNTFDCILVLISIPELIISSGSGGGSNFSAFRIFRLARMLRLLGKYPTLRQLLQTIIASVVAVAYLFLIMLLFIFIGGVLGLQLFEDAFPAESRANYNSLWESFLTVFIIITGESWATIMKEAIIGTNAAAVLYFVPLFIFGNYMLINLFIAILIDEFMRTKEKAEDTSTPEESHTQASQAAIALLQQNLANDETGSFQSVASNMHVLQTCSPIVGAKTMPSKEATGICGLFVKLDNYFFGAWRQVSDMTPEQRADFWDLHGHSLAYFKLERTNKFRLGLAVVVMHPLFDAAVLFVILANVVFLAVDNPSIGPEYRLILDIGDIVFTVLFTVELLAKVIVMGFYEAKDPSGVPKAYLTHKARLHNNEDFQGTSSMGVWNRMDLFVVLTAFAGIGVTELKLCRSLRTVRLVAHSEGIRVVIMSLFRALSGLANVTAVCLFSWLSFGIIAVQLFKGAFHYCNDELVNTRGECNGTYLVEELSTAGMMYVEVPREWHKLNYNFDNLGISMLTLFEVAVGDGWAVIMWSGIDARGVDLNPKRNANPLNALFFVLFVVVGQFFAMNLFVGMLIEVFSSSKAAEEGSVLMTPAQQKWVRANKMLSHIKLEPIPLVPRVIKYEGHLSYNDSFVDIAISVRAGVIGTLQFAGKQEPVSVAPGTRQSRAGCQRSLQVVGSSITFNGIISPEGEFTGAATVYGRYEGTFALTKAEHTFLGSLNKHFRVVCFTIALHPIFDPLITFLIVCNVVIMCLEHYQQDDIHTQILLGANSFFVAAFTLEAIMKIAAQGKNYFRDDWNKFDFLMVIWSYVGVTSSAPAVNVLRVLRIGRVFRLIRRAKNLQKLFGTLIHALPSLANVSLLLLVTFFIFGVVGVELFGTVLREDDNVGLTEYSNFKNVAFALVTLYQVSTTETWTDVMQDCMIDESSSKCKESENNCGTNAAVPYFVCFMIAGSFALLNLFITIVLDEFNSLADDDEGEVDDAPNWAGLTTNGQLKIHEKIALLENFRERWLKVDPLATGRIRVVLVFFA
ncbi:Muscle calcium channel subunit alpha-1 [Diplonema papillatum]|nr:Muscle calcium channel subunit alpha-1 [Diplonema papillatum]